MSLLSQQPFLSLVLTCLKGQDEQREDSLPPSTARSTRYGSLGLELGTWRAEEDAAKRPLMYS